MSDGTVGVYLHVPFCERVCPYCDFAVVASPRLERAREDAYVGALLAELEARSGDFARHSLATIYLGGGTPALLSAESVAGLVEAVRGAFSSSEPLEVTLEVNPSTVERSRLPDFRRAGVDRLSIGVQSFDDALLKRLGRAHRAEEGHATLAAARDAGFENLSMDLIFAIPDQTLAGWQRDVDLALQHRPEHVSAYELTVEAGTPYALAVERSQLEPPDEEVVVAMMDLGRDRLHAAGLLGYEISSYARAGFESRHNRRYWARSPVMGLGMGAGSIEPVSARAPHGARRANVRDLAAYLARVQAGESAAAGPDEILDAVTARAEAMMLGLRTAQGVDVAAFEVEFGATPEGHYPEAIPELLGAGLLERGGGSLRLTARGLRLADSVCERFVA